MTKKSVVALFLAMVMVLCTVQINVFAADPTIIYEDGTKIIFFSSFGRVSYEGKNRIAFRDAKTAFAELGEQGGTIILTGEMKVGSFDGFSKHGPITIKGTGTLNTANTINMCGTEENPIKEIHLKGDLKLEMLTAMTDKGAIIYTDGHYFDTANKFDAYNFYRYVKDGDNQLVYPSYISLAGGSSDTGVCSVNVSMGRHETVIGGAVSEAELKRNGAMGISGGVVETVVAGSTGGKMTGNVIVNVSDGEISKLVLGNDGGSLDGNISATISGGAISELVLGSTQGAHNGNVFAFIRKSPTIGKFTAGTSGGKRILALAAENIEIPDGVADYVIKISGGSVTPIYENNVFKGVQVVDGAGIGVKTITLNGAQKTSPNSIYEIPEGTCTIAVSGGVSPKLDKNAKYVAGYTDGTFKPQNNMTKAEAATLLARTLVDESLIKGQVKSGYSDVEAGSWYEPYVGLLEHLGYLDLVADKSGTKYSPNENITRGQFIQIVYKILTEDATETSAIKLKSVSDVTASNPFNPAILYAMSNGIITGYADGTFKPDANITRAEVVTIVNRMLGRTPTGNAGTVSFNDTAAHWANAQILAACNDEGVSWTATSGAGAPEYAIKGTSAKEYITALYEQGQTLSADAILRGIDTITEQMKKDIINTPNTEEIYGDKMTAKYYISEKNGNDDNDGTSPDKPCKTITGLFKKLKFPKRGTAVLFERGGIYRCSLPASFPGIIFGSYGQGPKPIVMQSTRNYADESLWVETDWENVWKCTQRVNNVGIIGFDHDLQDYSADSYNELYGITKNTNLFGFNGAQDLANDLEFYSAISNDKTEGGKAKQGDLFVYSVENPGKRFKSIEIGENSAITSGSGHDVIIDNISFKFTGGHAMGGAGSCQNRTVTNCIFSWLGGSILATDFRGSGRPVNYGNAVEIYGSCNGYYVKNNWMYQIYDTGVTHQFSDGTACTMENIEYHGNLIEYCHWGIEFYNADTNEVPKTQKYIKNVHTAYNVVNNSGYGWGSIVRHRVQSSYAHCGSSIPKVNENQLTEYNIFNKCGGKLINLPNGSNEAFDKNIYVQTIGNKLGNLKGSEVICGYDAADNFAKHLDDTTSITIVIEPPKEA